MDIILASLSMILSQLSAHLQEKSLDELILCESNGNPRAINEQDAKINGYPSKGILQFSPKTFLNKGKEYGFFPEDFTMKESDTLIWNENLQKAIALNMLAEEDGWRHWTLCSKKIGIARTSSP